MSRNDGVRGVRSRGWPTRLAAAVVFGLLTGCAVVPFPYWTSDRLEKGFAEAFPPGLRASDAAILVLEQRAQLSGHEGCEGPGEIGCGRESANQMIEPPVFARGTDLERIVRETCVERIGGVGLFAAMLPPGPAFIGVMTRSGSRLKTLAVVVDDGTVYCSRGPIEHHSLGTLFRSYKFDAAARDAVLAALQAPATTVRLPLVRGNCELAGALSWSDADRRQVSEFLKSIPVEAVVQPRTRTDLGREIGQACT